MWNPYANLDKTQRRILGLTAVVLVVIVWSVLTLGGFVPPSKLPSPVSVCKAFARLAWDGERGKSLLAEATMWSVGRVAAAGIVVCVVGIPLGALMGASPRINAFLSPLVDPFRSAPVVALSPILVMWLGIGESMKITFLVLGSVVYLIPMVRDAVVAVPQRYLVSAKDLGAGPFEAVWHGVIPLAKPRIADAVIVSTSIMWTYITVAEYINAEKGVGQLIQNARRFSAMDQVFVGIFVIIGLALITYGLMTWIKGKLFPWESER